VVIRRSHLFSRQTGTAAKPAPDVNRNEKEIHPLRQIICPQRRRGFRQAQSFIQCQITRSAHDGFAYCTVPPCWSRRRRWNSRRLPERAGFYVLPDSMAMNHVWFPRQELAVGKSRMAEQPELAPYTGHSWQRSAHHAWTLAAAHNDSVTVIVQLAHGALFKFREEGHSDVAAIHKCVGCIAIRKFMCREQCGSKHGFRRGILLFGRKIPEAVASMALINVGLRTHAHPCAAACVVVLIETLWRKGQRARSEIFRQAQPRKVSRMHSIRRPFFTPLNFRESFGRIVDRLFLSLHVGHEVFMQIKNCFNVEATLLRVRNSKRPAETDQERSSFHAQ